jgi:uncharacterized membrane protein YfcA
MLLTIIAIGLVAFMASTMAAITGTGGGILLLPVLVAFVGVRDAVPAYTLAQFLGNLSRVWFNRKQIEPQVVKWFALGAVPMAIVGGLLFVRTGDQTLTRLLGAFLLATVVWRRLHRGDTEGFPPHRFMFIGGVFAFVSALLGSAGPFLAPFFLSFGLTRGAYIGTEALATAIMHVIKMTTYGITGAFAVGAVIVGALLGPVMIAGSYLGKRVVDRIPRQVFVTFVEVVLAVFGLFFLIRG